MEKTLFQQKKIIKPNISLINGEFISKYNKWSLNFTTQVQFEYERFLELRNIDEKLSPSDLIDIFWHTHILDTKSYYDYCINKFGKIVHHNPSDSLNQEARKNRFCSTLNKYKEKFGSPIYFEIWNNSDYSCIFNNGPTSPSPSPSAPQLELPNYNEHIISEPNIIKIYH